jgi:hypothetical protein
MNHRAILSLLSDLYEQVTAYQRRIVELEERLAELRARPGERDKVAGDREQEPPEGPTSQMANTSG